MIHPTPVDQPLIGIVEQAPPGELGRRRRTHEPAVGSNFPVTETAQTEVATTLVRARFPDESWDTSSWSAYERLFPQVLAVTGHAERHDIAGEAAGWLLDRASTYLRERGQYRQARPLAERAVTITESALGPDKPGGDLVPRRARPGAAGSGDLPGARREFEEALRIGLAAVGPDHPNVRGHSSNASGAFQRLIEVPSGERLTDTFTANRFRTRPPPFPDSGANPRGSDGWNHHADRGMSAVDIRPGIPWPSGSLRPREPLPSAAPTAGRRFVSVALSGPGIRGGGVAHQDHEELAFQFAEVL